MNYSSKKNSTRLDNILCVLTIAAALGFVAYAAFASMVSPLAA